MLVRGHGRGPWQSRPRSAGRGWCEPGAAARVVARRLPGGARVTWLVILDHGLDPADPVVRAELASAVTELRAVTGAEDAAGSEPGIAQPW
jgi:hypothetical protein